MSGRARSQRRARPASCLDLFADGVEYDQRPFRLLPIPWRRTYGRTAEPSVAFSLQHPVAYRPRINSHSPTRNMGYATNSNDNFSSAFIAQFLQHVDQTPGHGPNGDGWLWEEGRTKNGYGRYGSSYAHRIMYAIHYGGLPPASSGLEVRHRCHVRRCVNPHHILLGNRKQNVNDSIKAGRHVHGSRSPMAKLS